MYVNEWGEISAVLSNDVSSTHPSLGVRVACMGAANHGHEHHRYDGHEHYGYEHHDHHDRYDNWNDGNHRYHHT
jgi:hypothetical protein